MQKVEVKVQVNLDRTVVVDLPDEVPPGEYDFAVWVPDGHLAEESAEAEDPAHVRNEVTERDVWSEEKTDAWQMLQTEIAQTKKDPQPAQNDFHKSLIEKYRKQGLDL